MRSASPVCLATVRSAGRVLKTLNPGTVVRRKSAVSSKTPQTGSSKTKLSVPNHYLTVADFPATSVKAEEYARLSGDWGIASSLVGRRWEQLGLKLLRERLPWSIPLGAGRTAKITHLISVDSAPESGMALNAVGLSAPDILLLGYLGNTSRPIIQAGDFKVSLDTANPEQVSASRLSTNLPLLASKLPEIASAVLVQAPSVHRERLCGLMAGNIGSTLVPEGIFVAPNNAFNRWLKSLLAFHRPNAPLPRLPRGAPATRSRTGFQLLAHLEPVSPETMLGSALGWPEAGHLANLDGVSLAGQELTLAERFWRLGAGLHGALRIVHRPVCSQLPAEWDATATFQRLVRTVKPDRASALLIAIADKVEQRQSVWEREKRILHCPTGFRTWLQHAEAAGLDVHLGELATRVRQFHGSLTAKHRQRVTDAACRLHHQGYTDGQVLGMLEAQKEEWQAATHQDLESILEMLVG